MVNIDAYISIFNTVAQNVSADGDITRLKLL